MTFELSTDGDAIEQYACLHFLETSFPSYEAFKKMFVLPLTKWPDSVHFKPDTEFNENPELVHAKICIAQLHYSAMRHLVSAHQELIRDFRALVPTETVHLLEKMRLLTAGLTFLVGAIDIAQELIQRFRELPTPKTDPWDDDAGRKARFKFRDASKEPSAIGILRRYRNHLVHGRLMPGSHFGHVVELFVPDLGKEEDYLDWRLVTEPGQLPVEDRAPATVVAANSFGTTVAYLDDLWRTYLLPDS